MKDFTFNNHYVKLPLPEGGFKKGQKILFMGFLKGVTGGYKEEDGEFYFRPDDKNTNTSIFEGNMGFFLNIINSGAELYVLSTKPTNVHFWTVMKKDMFPFVKFKFPDYGSYLSYIKKHMQSGRITGKDEDVPRLEKLAKTMKFDYIVQNPPYNGSLHLDFFEAGLDLLEENGKMVIIEPATWLINVRKNGKAKKYDAIKQRIEGHVESVKIENLNKDFNTAINIPFSVTTIDMSKNFDIIKFTVCGEEKEVKSIYDCNLVGDYAVIWSIFEKVMKFGDKMKNHVWKETSLNENAFRFITFMDICSSPASKNATSNATPDSVTWFTNTQNGDFFRSYFGVSFHPKCEISDVPQRAFKACGNSVAKKLYSDKYSTQLYGTREELENWKRFIFNNKLPLFLNIVLTIDQNNNSKDLLPWLVDKQYTDDEINKLFGFTDEEIKLIDRTIKKYERNSPWFKRYMCGHDSVSDEEVNNFILSLDEVC